MNDNLTSHSAATYFEQREYLKRIRQRMIQGTSEAQYVVQELREGAWQITCESDSFAVVDVRARLAQNPVRIWFTSRGGASVLQEG